ncbi:MAG: acyltransferase [bacterium]|nr:acyltransferase [bacterium]
MSTFIYTLQYFLFGVISCLLLLPAVFGEGAGGWPRRILASRALSWVGKISYGVFLWHHPLLMAMVKRGVGEWIPGHPFLSFGLAILPVSLLAGWASFRLIEEPAMRLRG